MGRRLKVQNANATTLNFPLGNDTSYEVKKEGTDTTVTKYISANGKYLAKAVQVNNGPEQKYFHHIDLVGSIRAITDATGTVTASYEYEPFGVTVKTTGTDQDNLGFTGKRLDEGSGLSYFGARYYDSEIGRFISKDPVKDGRNWYVYCANNPLGYRDPDGLKIIMHYGVMTDDEFLRETKGDSYGKESKSMDEWNKYYSLCMTAPIFRENYLEVLNSEETFIVNVTGDGPASSFETRSGTDEDPHMLIFNYKKIPYDAGVQKQMRLDSALNHEFGHAASEARKDMGSVYTNLYSVFDNLGTTFGSWGMKNLSKWFNDVALWLRNKAENYNINRNEKVYDKFMGYEEYRDKYSYL